MSEAGGAAHWRLRDALRLWGPVVVWAGLVFVLSSRVVPPASHIPDWMTHSTAYAVLAVLVCRGIAGGLDRPVTLRVAALGALISVVYGVTDEFHQSFVPGRFADEWDVLKDLAGALAGAAACAWPRPAEQRREAP